MFQLAATGLVEHTPHRGAFAVEIGPQHISEMFEVIAELMALHGTCAVAAQSGSRDDYDYTNEAFHKAIRVISGNHFLQAVVARIQKRMLAGCG